jgi:hypothetical protein
VLPPASPLPPHRPTIAPRRPPYALEPAFFRFPALAALAGRAALGGPREVALATYLAARLAQDTLPDRGLSHPTRAERAANARNWLSSITLPQAVRPAFSRLVEASSGTPAAASQALRGVMAVTAQFLDAAARSELDQLAAALEAQTIVR